MNFAGVKWLIENDFRVPDKFSFFSADDVKSLNLDFLYDGAVKGLSLYVNPSDIRVSDGPNGRVPFKHKSTHGIKQEDFVGVFERVRDDCLLPVNRQNFAVSHTVSGQVVMGICVKYVKNCFGYVQCDATFGPRAGDFTPEISITDPVVVGRRKLSERSVFVGSSRPEFAGAYAQRESVKEEMFRIMHIVDRKFGAGNTGLEFIIDTESGITYFNDFYRSG